ncbi:MAG: ABC transporter substrate-binding protein [Saccharofermentanales bacterium]
MKRNILSSLLICAFLLALALAGCNQVTPSASNPPPSEPKQTEPKAKVEKIVYTHLGDWATDYFEKASSDFTAQTGIEVDRQFWPFQDGYEKYVTAIAGGDAPDCGMGFGEWAAEFYERGAIIPLNDLVSAEYSENLYDSARATSTYKGNLIGLPFITSIRTPIYRADIFEAKDLEPPTTIDKLLTACKALYNPPELYGYGLCSARNKNTTEFFLELFWPLGGEILSADETKVAFNSPAGIRALEIFAELAETCPEGYQTSDIYLGENAFTAGNLAVMINAPWIVSSLKENIPDAKAVILPYIEGSEGNKGNLYVADLVYVFSKDPQRAQASVDWIEFYKSDEKYLGEAYANFGLPPDLKFQTDWAFMESETAKILQQAVEFGRARPITAAWPQIDDAISVAVGKVCAGQATPADALAEAEQLANDALASVA